MALLTLISLILLGLWLSLLGGVMGTNAAFQESSTWGLLYLLVPFAFVAFSIKFWDRQKARYSLLLNLAGLVALGLAIGVAISYLSSH